MTEKMRLGSHTVTAITWEQTAKEESVKLIDLDF